MKHWVSWTMSVSDCNSRHLRATIPAQAGSLVAGPLSAADLSRDQLQPLALERCCCPHLQLSSLQAALGQQMPAARPVNHCHAASCHPALAHLHQLASLWRCKHALCPGLHRRRDTQSQGGLMALQQMRTAHCGGTGGGMAPQCARAHHCCGCKGPCRVAVHRCGPGCCPSCPGCRCDVTCGARSAALLVAARARQAGW